jgi:hypothetical protein
MYVRATAVAATAIGLMAAGSAVAARAPRIDTFCQYATGAQVSWAFHASRGHSLTRGSGTVSGRQATGTVCQEEQQSATSKQHVKIAVTSGSAVRLQRGITVSGVLGAQLVVPFRVSASDDAACPAGTTGKLTLFNSYNGAGQDRVAFSFAGTSCRAHAHSYRGAGVAVSIPH